MQHQIDTGSFTPQQLLQLAALYEYLEDPDKAKATWQRLFSAPWDASVATAVTQACRHLLMLQQEELGRELLHDKECGALCELQVLNSMAHCMCALFCLCDN